MKRRILSVLSVLGAMALAQQAQANATNFEIDGPGVSGQGSLTYTFNADGSAAITGISGTFSDSNAGINGKPNISNANITGLIPINPVSPLPPFVVAPDFSEFAILNGVPSPPAFQFSPTLSYDNTFYPNGSPIVCTDYPFSGGSVDVYGLLFTLSNGDVVDLWSNGIQPGPPTSAIYGLAVADATNTYDYVGGGVNFNAPEPSALAVMVVGIAGLGLARRRKVQA